MWQSPRRALIGPVTLARILQRLAEPALDLPALLNIAHPGLVAMADLLQAAGLPFAWRPAPATALPELALDVRRLCALYPLPPACAQTLLAFSAFWLLWSRADQKIEIQFQSPD